MRIRPAVTADDHDLARLRRRTWSPLHSPTPRPEGPVGRYFDATHRPHEVLVAEVDGRVAGYVRLVPVSSLTAQAHYILAVPCLEVKHTESVHLAHHVNSQFSPALHFANGWRRPLREESGGPGRVCASCGPLSCVCARASPLPLLCVHVFRVSSVRERS